MERTLFDRIARIFSDRARSRRQVVRQGSIGLAAGAVVAGLAPVVTTGAATPEPDATPATEREDPVFLFLQAFQSGRVDATQGSEGRYTLTLEQGLGQTIYFSDRPDRIVGATPTSGFLGGLGFPDDNPPNAALVVETAEGQTEIAVVELFAPAYDEATHTATYEVAVLAEWERDGEGSLTETTADLAGFGAGFGAAHLFIDDCPDGGIQCYAGDPSTEINLRGTLSGVGFCWDWNTACCKPCDPNWYAYWVQQCDQVFGCDRKYAYEPGYCWATMLSPALACPT